MFMMMIIRRRNTFNRQLRQTRVFGLTWLYLGKIKQNIGDDVKAYKLLLKAFLCDPEDNEISYSYYRCGCTDRFCDSVIVYFKNVLRWYPDNKHLHYLQIDLLIRSKQYESAMELIEKSIVVFGKRDGILDAALSVRKLLGPEEGDTKSKDQTAVVNIESEINNLEEFLYHLKRVVKRIDFVDKADCPASKNIASVFGATIVSEHPLENDNSCYGWTFEHQDVVAWLEDSRIEKQLI